MTANNKIIPKFTNKKFLFIFDDKIFDIIVLLYYTKIFPKQAPMAQVSTHSMRCLPLEN